MSRLSALSADSMEGRRAGTEGSRRARRWIISQLTAIGAQPFGPTFEQAVRVRAASGSSDTLGANIIARIPARTPSVTGANTAPVIVLSAHYDHLGVRNGQIYNGADDDASGCVTLLMLAERLRSTPLDHDVILAFFDGEEIGMPGSMTFINTPPVDLSRIAIDISLDMVSRQDGKALWVSGTSHYPQLKPITDRAAMGASIDIRFGHDTKSVKADDDWTTQSDHAVFHAKGIPFLYLGVEDHPDYHQPGDDAEKVDPVFFRAVMEFSYRLVREVDRWVGSIPRKTN